MYGRDHQALVLQTKVDRKEDYTVLTSTIPGIVEEINAATSKMEKLLKSPDKLLAIHGTEGKDCLRGLLKNDYSWGLQILSPSRILLYYRGESFNITLLKLVNSPFKNGPQRQLSASGRSLLAIAPSGLEKI